MPHATLPMSKRKVYWTPARIRKLYEASGVGSQAAFAALVRVSPQLVNDWLKGRYQPQPVMELALDCLADRFGIPTSPDFKK